METDFKWKSRAPPGDGLRGFGIPADHSDASVVVAVLANAREAHAVSVELAMRADAFLAPYLIDIEVLSALRKMVTLRRVDSIDSKRFLATLAALPIQRCPHQPLLDRIWELRQNFTAYDAAYIALAEETDSVLYTMDAKLRRGHRAKVKVFAE